MISKKRLVSLGILIGLPLLTALLTSLNITTTPYIVFGVVCLVIVLVALKVIKETEYPFYIYGLALAMVWQSTLMGYHVTGTDIQDEAFRSRLALEYGWDFTKLPQHNASIVVGFIVPWLARIADISVELVYKVILPIMLAGVPLVLYVVFNRQFGSDRAFYATIFFIIIPTYTLEMVQIGKSMVAELFFALMLLAMVSNMKAISKFIMVLAMVILTGLSHYTVGIITMCYIVATFGVRLVTTWFKNRWTLWGNTKMHVLSLFFVVVLVVATFGVYFSVASEGVIWDVVTRVTGRYTGTTEFIQNQKPTAPVEEPVKEPYIPPTYEELVKIWTNYDWAEFAYLETNGIKKYYDKVLNPEVEKEQIIGQNTYLAEQPPMVRTALGLDFFTVDTPSKIFRVIQYITQIVILVGAVYLLFNYKKYKMTAEYVACIGASFILLAFVLFVPQFASIINTTRFYQLSLFFLSPVFVVGCEGITSMGVKVFDKITYGRYTNT